MVRASWSKLYFSIGALTILSAILNNISGPYSSFDLSSRKLSASTDEHLEGKRVLVAISSYGVDQILYLEDMIDSFHDLCEIGAKVTLYLYTTEPYSIEQLSMFNARTTCYHPTGSLDITVKIKPPALKLHFVDAHRRDFYDRINDFDLFIYTEDDHQIRPTHVAGYLHETAKLKNLVGEEAFPNYSIGFLRYERDHDVENKRFTFDQHQFKDAGLHAFENKLLQKHYIGNRRMPHQGMFMATAEQLLLWKSRCQFDEIDPFNVEKESQKGTPSWHREYVSSLRLFANEGVKKNCEVTQLFPMDTFMFFMVHHMPDKYYSNPNFNKENLMSSDKLHRLVLKMAGESNMEARKKLGKDGTYNGVTMEMAPEYSDAMEEQNNGDADKISPDVRHSMLKYYEFVRNGGDMLIME